MLDLYRLALSRDAVLQAATSQRDAAIEARPQALSQLLPQVSANASAGREREGIQENAATTTATTTQAANCTLSSGAQTQYCYTDSRAYGLTLSQTLWSFESFSRLKEANFLAASAQANLLAAQQSLVAYESATAYFQEFCQQRINSQTNRTGHARAFGTLLNQARIRERIGTSPRSEVAQAQAFYDATEQSVLDAQNTLDDAELEMTEIVGPHSADIAALMDEIPLASPDPESVEEWVSSAKQDNPTVRAALLQAQAQDRDIAVQRGKGLPTLSLNVSTAHTWQDQAFGGNQICLDQVGISFNWPLFQSGAVSSAVRQSRALYRQAEALYDTSQRDADRLTRAAYRGVVTGIARIGAAKRAVESGRASVEASQRNVEFGTGSVFDLLNAQNNYYAAQRAYSQTRYDYLTALLTLKQQAGRLLEHDLTVIDQLLITHEH